MKVAVNTVTTRNEYDLAWRLFGGFLLAVLVTAGGLKAFFTWLFTDKNCAAPRSRSWLAEARSQASIATSYAHMAKTMLRSSRRDNRQERQSRL
ncbi:hypothetical protein GJ654_03135 [Rhodoblastus acidophilus]|jgi:hypothetical protein|uniref:Uncharacterized protein n=1 Tax=Rhodoblastus acidophilus TaxID=1074 RepID=A0A6N8DL83_RHOAC|nr:hypothetical protein [Rhodoblastus acidophilus]MCW2273085.1 hypothetical protein [Rhodoblastus acidophilus]MTV29983.1 hypothetical protein [Rhodoblastus acidophilus]